MPEPTLQEVFGANATQTATVITINKGDLANIGLTASATNRGESLLMAILMNASNSLTEVARSTDPVNRNVTVQYGGQDLVEQSGANYRRDVYSVLAYKSTPLQTVDPDDY
jgi:hypothetical protein